MKGASLLIYSEKWNCCRPWAQCLGYSTFSSCRQAVWEAMFLSEGCLVRWKQLYTRNQSYVIQLCKGIRLRWPAVSIFMLYLCHHHIVPGTCSLRFINVLSTVCLLCASYSPIALSWCLDGAHRLGLCDFSLMC